jgi:hypothetical protein
MTEKQNHRTVDRCRRHCRRLGLLTLAALLYLTPAFAISPEAGECTLFLRSLFVLPRATTQLWNYLRPPQDIRHFDFSLYAAAKSHYRALLARPDDWPDLHEESPPKRLEEKIAFLEAIDASIRNHPMQLISGNRFVRGASRGDISWAFGKVDFSKGLSEIQLEELSARLYLATHTDPRHLTGLLRHGWSASVRSLLAQRFERDFAQKGLKPILEEMGLLRSPTVWERIRKLVRHHPLAGEIVLTTAWGLPVLNLAPPFYLPAIEPVTWWDSIPDELFQRALRDGFDSIYPDLKQRYGRQANFQIGYAHLRHAYDLFLLAYLLQVIQKGSQDQAIQNAQALQNGKDLGQTVDKKSGEVTPPATLGQELFERWQHEYAQRHGGQPPDPSGAEYQRMRQIFLTPVPQEPAVSSAPAADAVPEFPELPGELDPFADFPSADGG